MDLEEEGWCRMLRRLLLLLLWRRVVLLRLRGDPLGIEIEIEIEKGIATGSLTEIDEVCLPILACRSFG